MQNIKEDIKNIKLDKEINSKKAMTILISTAAIAAVVVIVVGRIFPSSPLALFPVSFPDNKIEEFKEFETFKSEDEFKDYLVMGQSVQGASFGGGWGLARNMMLEESMMGTSVKSSEAGMDGGEVAPDRISETNVQVQGIDEPDIVKTDGNQIYFSAQNLYRYWNEVPKGYNGETKIIKAFPPAELKTESSVDKAGNLLLKDDMLVVFSGNEITGFNVEDSVKPEKEWWITLENNSYLASARLINNTIYIVTGQRINNYRPCPISPMIVDGTEMEIRCVDIYHPNVNTPVDVTYTALAVDIKTGKTENQVSFVGNSGNSIQYVSENAIYSTYNYQQDLTKFIFNFFEEKASDIIPELVRQKLQKLSGYDISQSAKQTELGVIIEGFRASLTDDERLRIDNELTNRMSDYYKDNKRELQKTGIVSISLDSFEVDNLGSVPGTPLNQFSLDEYDGYLRIATTIGRTWTMFGNLGESESDVYVLNKALNIIGSVEGLGKGERIYSARFIGDKGYIVTFKQIDPFFVLDLSNPENPEVKGELKIPGYSSYLHPVTPDKILGVGKEGSNVKLSMFDVSDAENPKEVAKYLLNEYWSDILNTHHAFLLDSKHEIFFLPGSRGGYVFSYANNKLELERVVSDISARRAVYINDYLYIIGDDRIVVLNELDWERVNELEL